MLFKQFWLWTLAASLALCGCAGKSFGMIADPDRIYIHHFATALFQWIETDDPEVLHALLCDYPQMLAMLDNALFKTNLDDSIAFFSRLKDYYADPSLQSLYKDAITVFDADAPATKQVENELSLGFTRLKSMLPTLQVPAVYMHVSGLQQNIIVADSLLSFSIDKYLGRDYPLYKEFFHGYRLKDMTPECAASDGLYAWLASEYPYREKASDLLELMVYEGKLIHLLTQAGCNYTPQHLMSLTDADYQWCLKNESAIWKTLFARKHAETTEKATIARYFHPAPSVFFSEDAPGNLGKFVGYRIVAKYMQQTRESCQHLMNHCDAQEILKKSKYKP